jgi:uncharacterized C2H2 Zn-finger protein
LTTTKKPTCPECGKKYNTAKGMASHRRSAHGVAGSSNSTRSAAAQKIRMEGPVFKCSECGEVFPNNMKLGLHRKAVHGIMGEAHSSRKARIKRDRYLANYKRNEQGSLICPECGTGWGAKGIALHRLQSHGLNLLQQQALFKQAKSSIVPVAEIEAVPVAEIADPLKCVQCDLVAKDERGMRTHASRSHQYSNSKGALRKREERNKAIDSPTQAITIAQTNGNIGNSIHAEEAHSAAGGYTIPDATLALALGRFQGLCASISTEFDLPPRMFATRLAELIYHSQVRTASRPRMPVPTL